MERYVKSNVGDGWARETERLLKADIIPKLGAKRMSDVKRSDVHDLLDDIVDRGAPIIANRTLAVFRRLCNWAVERGIIATSPCEKVKAPAAENSRDRVLGGDRKDAFVFTTTGATPVSGFSRAKDAIDTAIVDGLKADAVAEAPERWTFHDLRRTAASGMAGIGIAPHVVEAVLNHKSGTIKGVAAVYNRYSYAMEKRQALDAWARRLEATSRCSFRGASASTTRTSSWPRSSRGALSSTWSAPGLW